MKNLNLVDVANNIKKIFLEQDRYVFDKKVTEFNIKDQFVGDIINFLMFDGSTTPPIFYEVSTPFDLISKKAPQHALVYRDGKCIFQTDYTEYAAMRTGVMDGLILSHTHKDKLKDKKVLMFGSGKTASWSIKGLAALVPELAQIDYFSLSGQKAAFEELGQELGMQLQYQNDWRGKLSEYDIVLCHTRVESPFLNESDIKNVKDGAQIHSYITSTEHGELADEFYTNKINLVSDWPKVLEYNKILMRVVDNKQVEPSNISYLREVFSGEYVPKPEAPYTIFQFSGTPIQNLAVLQLLTSAA